MPSCRHSASQESGKAACGRSTCWQLNCVFTLLWSFISLLAAGAGLFLLGKGGRNTGSRGFVRRVAGVFCASCSMDESKCNPQARLNDAGYLEPVLPPAAACSKVSARQQSAFVLAIHSNAHCEAHLCICWRTVCHADSAIHSGHMALPRKCFWDQVRGFPSESCTGSMPGYAPTMLNFPQAHWRIQQLQVNPLTMLNLKTISFTHRGQ